MTPLYTKDIDALVLNGEVAEVIAHQSLDGAWWLQVVTTEGKHHIIVGNDAKLKRFVRPNGLLVYFERHFDGVKLECKSMNNS